MDLKLGKLPAAPQRTDLLFAAYRTPLQIDVPANFGDWKKVMQWRMLGNDRYGDCVFAGGAHETMLWNAVRGSSVPFDDKSVLSDYSVVTGFTPDDPSTDRGTDVHNALNYRRHTGLVDANGVRHKIGGYVSLKPGDTKTLAEAAYLFDVVAIGIEFPSYAMDQFNADAPWSYRGKGSIEGGHYIPLVGRHGRYFLVVTWGRVQRVTATFLKHFCDEAFAVFSTEFLVDGKSPLGIDQAGLLDDLAHLGS